MSEIAKTPEPPYYAVIFSSHRTEGDNGYSEMAERNRFYANASNRPATSALANQAKDCTNKGIKNG